ncbi:peptidase [Pseudomonas paralcaligenes]|uniref:peptidase n=1 Tax=Pseudomonas paralcaligenes TaxID=2772558 RepID=UPI0021D10264|nr:peptidase [Pseudomonas paralcaligenes]
MNTPTATLPILPAGQHVALDGRPVEFTEAILREIVETYDPTLHEAPLVIGHPKLNAPAYGWAKGLEVRDGMLFAEPHQVVPEFAEAANRKMYKKRSASVYLPDSPGNPTPGKHYLRHIGFLGAMPPAIKGIPDAAVSFAESDGSAVVEFAEPPYAVTGVLDILRRVRDFFIEREGAERAEQLIPMWQILSIDESARREADRGRPMISFSEQPTHEQGAEPVEASAASPAEPDQAAIENDGGTAAAAADAAATPSDSQQQEPNMTDKAALDERERQLAEREQKVAASEAQHAAQAADEKRREVAEFAEGLVAAGKLLPRQKQPVVELMLNLPAAPLEFAEGDQQVSKPGEDVLRELLSALPAQVDFAEKSAGRGRDLDVDDAQAVADAARAYQAEQAKLGNTVSTRAAVRHVTKGA